MAGGSRASNGAQERFQPNAGSVNEPDRNRVATRSGVRRNSGDVAPPNRNEATPGTGVKKNEGDVAPPNRNEATPHSGPINGKR